MAGASTVMVWEVVVWLWRWFRSHRRYVPIWAGVSVVAALMRREPVGAWLAAGLVLPVLLAGWAFMLPGSYERLVAGPGRRRRWRRFLRREWVGLAEACGWTRTVTGTRARWNGTSERTSRTVTPRLRKVTTRGATVRLVIRARRGQTLEVLEAGVPALAASVDAVSARSSPLGGSSSTLLVELVMFDALADPRDAVLTQTVPDLAASTPGVGMGLGRREVGGDWLLTIAGRHTLTAGCTGSGKGSVLWGTACHLAPYVPSDTVRLWGIDLKHGVELMMGRDLFTVVADTGEDAVAVLGTLLAVIEARGTAMAGTVRSHTPAPGDPLHVLVIDELADLIAYAERDVRIEAGRLLAKILTKGRALGVVVLAFVQDPRKEVVGMRNLFTQRVALRLQSVEETTMVLGDAAAKTAPAHRIPETAQGMAWVVDDAGHADRVRADYWPDDLIRQVAARYPCPVPFTLPTPTAEDPERSDSAPRPSRTTSAGSARATRRPRSTSGTGSRTQEWGGDAA